MFVASRLKLKAPARCSWQVGVRTYMHTYVHVDRHTYIDTYVSTLHSCMRAFSQQAHILTLHTHVRDARRCVHTYVHTCVHVHTYERTQICNHTQKNSNGLAPRTFPSKLPLARQTFRSKLHTHTHRCECHCPTQRKREK